ncbi:hypothetical protein PRUPE_6G346100 [Prunus persica]|uniref:Uncharacterized protein n=1 Tax=Prunus persica TaxID=3760 RepID=M5W5B7_PRUPE|nr:hypothetical protein PRUPE_6G346100 [Prunus persica]
MCKCTTQQTNIKCHTNKKHHETSCMSLEETSILKKNYLTKLKANSNRLQLAFHKRIMSSKSGQTLGKNS